MISVYRTRRKIDRNGKVVVEFLAINDITWLVEKSVISTDFYQGQEIEANNFTDDFSAKLLQYYLSGDKYYDMSEYLKSYWNKYYNLPYSQRTFRIKSITHLNLNLEPIFVPFDYKVNFNSYKKELVLEIKFNKLIPFIQYMMIKWKLPKDASANDCYEFNTAKKVIIEQGFRDYFSTPFDDDKPLIIDGNEFQIPIEDEPERLMRSYLNENVNVECIYTVEGDLMISNFLNFFIKKIEKISLKQPILFERLWNEGE